MNIIRLILKEILSRKTNFILGLIAVIMTVAMFVAFYTSSEASDRETKRLTRDMGFNLRIIPKETNMDDFWLSGFSKNTMPEEFVLRFNQFKDFSYAHLTATLHQKIQWREMNIILTGISPEIEPSGKKKSPMIFTIEQGTVYLGYEVATRYSLKKGDTIDILGKQFEIAKTLVENGSDDDIRIFAPLAEVQEVLNMKGMINEIKALDCLCLIDDHKDAITHLREQLVQVMPEGKLIVNQTIAVAREKQRRMLDGYFALLIPVLIFVCTVWIGTLAYLNVKERMQEIGILRALGYGASKTAVLFLGRALILGVVGAILGFVLGTVLSVSYGPDIFVVTAKSIQPIYSLLIWSILLAPLFAVIASFIPTMIAISKDPAIILRDN